MNYIPAVRVLVQEALLRWRSERIYRKFRDFTMLSRRAYRHNLKVASQVRDVPGCVIECGVWRGGMTAGLAAWLGPEREYFLFDSFEGLPPAKQIDGHAALAWQADKVSHTYYDNCSASPEFAKTAMERAGARRFHLIKGWFEKTIPAFKPPMQIALLRLDGDWYDSTMVCLNHLFDYVAPGGIIIFDDYFAWEGCSRAVHDFLSKRSSPDRLRSDDGICYLLRPPMPLSQQ